MSDRYLPLRKTPGSSKDLHLDFIEWKEEQTTHKNEKKGMSVVDFYRTEVLG